MGIIDIEYGVIALDSAKLRDFIVNIEKLLRMKNIFIMGVKSPVP